MELSNRRFTRALATTAAAFLAVASIGSLVWAQTNTTALWPLAKEAARQHRFSTLFTAQDVRQYLTNPESLQDAINWCKDTAVTKVYIESYRDGYQAERPVLETAARAFRKADILVSGCVTPTRVGKSSTGWRDVISCYTDRATQDRIQAIFEFTAGLFDEIMIDDFWFTDCACLNCELARRTKSVVVNEKTYPVAGDGWDDYRCELMLQVSLEKILKPAKRVNPRVQLIIKYPQWYDNFHVRGYDVVRETEAFDRIWVGTETRDYNDQRWGGTPQYEGYFIMRWLGEIGGVKCGGGWFDPLGTTEATYIEQARQTVLAGARESMLFAYGPLQSKTGVADVRALRGQIPELLRVADKLQRRKPIGVAAYKPPGSAPENEGRVFDFVGMMGFPLVPVHEFPTNAPAAFFSVHALKDPQFAAKLQVFLKAGKPVLMTDGLSEKLKGKLEIDNVTLLKVEGNPKQLLDLGRRELGELRAPLLAALGQRIDAPNRVGVYLFEDGSWVVENFNDQPAEVSFGEQIIKVAGRGWKYHWK